MLWCCIWSSVEAIFAQNLKVAFPFAGDVSAVDVWRSQAEVEYLGVFDKENFKNLTTINCISYIEHDSNMFDSFTVLGLYNVSNIDLSESPLM